MVSKSLLALLIVFLSATAASLSAQQATTSDPDRQSVPEVQATSPATPGNPARKPARRMEDWSVLPLESSGLNLQHVSVLQLTKWDKGDVTEELLRAEWRPHDPIDLYIVLPKGVEKPPAILYLYDFSNDTERFRDERWCKQVAQGGFAAVAFLSAVSGDRIHMPRPIKEWFVSELQESLGSSVHDVELILNYLGTRGDIDVNRIGMFGQGSGASIAVLAAAADPRIKTLDLFEPWGDWPDWLKYSPVVPDNLRPNYLTPEFLDKVGKLDPVLYLPQLKEQKVRIEYILDDGIVPKLAREAVLTAAPENADIIRYRDTADHVKAFHSNGLSGWLKAQLQTVPSPTPAQLDNGQAETGVASSRP